MDNFYFKIFCLFQKNFKECQRTPRKVENDLQSFCKATTLLLEKSIASAPTYNEHQQVAVSSAVLYNHYVSL